jgi:hypothetical protein
MKRTFSRPVLPADAPLTENKLAMYGSRKIVFAGMSKRIEAALDDVGMALGVSVYALTGATCDYRFLLGVLNSKLLTHLFRIRYQAKHLAGGFLAINKKQLEELPIPVIAKTDRVGQARHDEIVRLVNSMIELNGQLPKAKTPHEQESLKRTIEATDSQIDALVYELYGLNEEDIRIVEEGSK